MNNLFEENKTYFKTKINILEFNSILSTIKFIKQEAQDQK